MDFFKVAAGAVVGEAELLMRAQNGERQAFNELVLLHAQGVRNVIFRMCGDTQIAEDAAQETFIQAWLRIASFRPQASLRSWLYRIAINAAIDMLRREKRILPGDMEEMQLKDTQPGPEALVSQVERIAAVQKAISILPDASRAVVVLREYEGLSYQEIADTLDIPVGTVMSRLNYGRKVLKERLEKALSVSTEADYVQAR
jgi:RNA polymerase sigma-70 factor (ECF subfamily)